ncbi:MAG TPA: HNH endonuclease signature motif containing protein, partial [Ilumatobacteraceae bacterium]
MGLGQIDELTRVRRNQRAARYLDTAAVDMLVEYAEHLSMRSFSAVVERWLMWADPDGAWHDQTESIDNRTAQVVAADGELSIGASGGDALTAEAMRNIFAHFLELEFCKDCDARRGAHGDRADEFPLPRSDAQRRFDALVAIFERAYAATGEGKPVDPVVNIICDQRSLHDLLGRAGIALADGETVDLDILTRNQIDAVLAEFVNDPSSMLSRRCETSSGQQIDPQLLIRGLLTAQVRRVVLDANSTVIDLGERRRLFTGNARLAATMLERFCQHPGCEVAADRCQIDHNESHSLGGRTDQSNAGPACGPHNRHKYTHGWRRRRADSGRIYNIRADGTLVLFVGERPPPFTRVDARENR